MSHLGSRAETPPSGRGARIAEALDVVCDGLDSLTAPQWAAPSLCDGWSVKDTISHLVWRVGTGSFRITSDVVRASVAGHHMNPMRTFDDIARGIADSGGTDELRRQMRVIAREKAVGRGRTNIGELAEVVVHGYDAMHPLQISLPFAADTTHRVASMSALKASRSTRALLRHRTLVAVDAGWRIGSGSEIVADAASIVLFLNGRKAMQPPERAAVFAPVPRPGLA
ncbi:MAG: maleylpyruvate isomerase family mycothiol-dependent enzyme [Mycetocola sp.]